jgi:hypothetical protein
VAVSWAAPDTAECAAELRPALCSDHTIRLYCTRLAPHEGDHEAQRTDDAIVACWPRDGHWEAAHFASVLPGDWLYVAVGAFRGTVQVEHAEFVMPLAVTLLCRHADAVKGSLLVYASGMVARRR